MESLRGSGVSSSINTKGTRVTGLRTVNQELNISKHRTRKKGGNSLTIETTPVPGTKQLTVDGRNRMK